MVGPKLIITDNMIFDGSLYLLEEANIQVNEYITINDHMLEAISPSAEPTHIIVLGTPWVWDRCWESFKYENLEYLFKAYPNAKRLFMGIGSCYPLGKEEDIKDSIKSNINELIDIFEGSTVITRDCLAYTTLEQFNPVLLPCPAFYAIRSFHVSSALGPVMFWYDPSKGITSVDYTPYSKSLDEYIKRFQIEYNMYKPKVYCVDEKEIDLAVNIGLPKPEVLKSSTHTKMILQHASHIISGRVHLAIPAHSIGAVYKSISLTAVDSRATTLSDVDHALITHPNPAKKLYKELLQDWL